MKKIIFANNTELEISDIFDAGNLIKIEIESSYADAAIARFKDNADATGIMKYYVGTDLIKGFSGYTQMESLHYVPHVTTAIDYETADSTTESGFAETYADKITVTMQKPVFTVSGGGAEEIAEIKEDIQKINNALEGIE